MPIDYQNAMRQLASLKQERKSYEPHWKELQDYFLPRRGRYIEQSSTARGNKQNQNLVDPSPRLAARVLGAGMHAGSTNPSTPWFKLETPDPELNEFPSVSQWLYTVTQRMRDVFERSNLYSVLPMTYQDAGVFGTSPITVLEHPTQVIHCVPSPIGSHYLGTDEWGNVVTKYCEYKMTAQQMAMSYGKDLPANVSNALRNQSTQEQFDVLHVIEPNTGRKWDSWDSANMPFRSAYLMLNEASEKRALKQSGFEDNPLAVFRWEVTEITDPYGSSPGMDALGLSKALQVQTRRKAQAIDKLVDPPMVGDPQLQNSPSTLIPGGVTWAGFTQTGSAPKWQPAYVIKPEVNALVLDIQDTRATIQQAMYTDLFLAITMADPRNATAEEIAARYQEKILMLGPTLQNHRHGLIEPIIERTFNIMMRQGRLPPPPPELEGVDLKVEMQGLLAQALKAVASSSIERFVNFVGLIAKAQADAGTAPTALDKFDALQAVDEYGLAVGVPPTLIRSDAQVAEIQAQRAQQQQQAQSLEAAQPIAQVAKAAKDLSETTVQGGSALDAMVESAQ